jgi:nitrate reductase gamma subunit
MIGMLMAVLLYAGAATLLLGVALRVVRYLRTPAPLKIPTMPAPTTRAGVALRMLREVVLFESLFKATRWTWLAGWIFHAALLLVVVAHLRFFLDPVPSPVIAVLAWLRPASIALVVALVALALRRLCVDRVRYISAPSDHLLLLLLLAIALSGLLLGTVLYADVLAVRRFGLGLARFSIEALPAEPMLLAHLLLVALLMAVFPFSKLLHAPGVFFSPTRYQVDDGRRRRASARSRSRD